MKKYLDLAPKGTKLKTVATPFIDESIRRPDDFGHPPLTPEQEKQLLEEASVARDAGLYDLREPGGPAADAVARDLGR